MDETYTVRRTPIAGGPTAYLTYIGREDYDGYGWTYNSVDAYQFNGQMPDDAWSFMIVSLTEDVYIDFSLNHPGAPDPAILALFN